MIDSTGPFNRKIQAGTEQGRTLSLQGSQTADLGGDLVDCLRQGHRGCGSASDVRHKATSLLRQLHQAYSTDKSKAKSKTPTFSSSVEYAWCSWRSRDVALCRTSEERVGEAMIDSTPAAPATPSILDR
jgi:hypothetical protein